MAKNLSEKTNEELKKYIKKHTRKLQNGIKALETREGVQSAMNLQVIVTTKDDKNDYWADTLIGYGGVISFMVHESEALKEVEEIKATNMINELLDHLAGDEHETTKI